jgi:hypothetical protein
MPAGTGLQLSAPIRVARGLAVFAGYGEQITLPVDRAAIAISFGGFKGYRLVADGT